MHHPLPTMVFGNEIHQSQTPNWRAPPKNYFYLQPCITGMVQCQERAREYLTIIVFNYHSSTIWADCHSRQGSYGDSIFPPEELDFGDELLLPLVKFISKDKNINTRIGL